MGITDLSGVHRTAELVVLALRSRTHLRISLIFGWRCHHQAARWVGFEGSLTCAFGASTSTANHQLGVKLSIFSNYARFTSTDGVYASAALLFFTFNLNRRVSLGWWLITVLEELRSALDSDSVASDACNWFDDRKLLFVRAEGETGLRLDARSSYRSRELSACLGEQRPDSNCA